MPLVALWATKDMDPTQPPSFCNPEGDERKGVEPLRDSVGIPGVGIDAMPPPASGLPARLVLGPALRAQSDGRLVRLVREGYESAFEEIVRRYRRPLDRFAAGIVGGRSEDVTQDSFRKALEALRHGDSDVELRPWLYRIVRNTALNDLRDRPPAAAELAEELMGGARSAAAEAEERAEIATLTARMRALPENQRAALVMRELEGMSHEEIAAALGISGGAARQAISRARTAVRSGFGALVPLPLLRALAGGSDGGAEAAAEAAGGVGAAGGAAAIGGGFGAGALKVGLATVVVAGSLGAGAAIQHHGGDQRSNPPKAAVSATGGPSADGARATPTPVIAEIDDHSSSGGHDSGDDHGGTGPNDHGRDGRGHGGSGRGDDSHGSGGGHGDTSGGPGPSGSGQDGGSGRGGPSDDSHQSGPGASGHGHSTSSDHSGSGSGDGDGSRHGGSGSSSGDGSGHGSGTSGGGDSRSGSGSGSSTSTSGGHGSDDAAESVVGTVPAAPSTSGGSESSSSGSGSSGSSGGSGSSDDSPTTSGDSSSSSGSSGGPTPSLDTTIVTDDGSGSGGGSGSSGGS
jgi:RNA polymerase sigma factor (sigma-70 family)